MFGVEAARHVNERFTGHSIHRRGTRTTSGFIDGHCRMTDHVIREIQADSNYLLGLGVEFANLDPAIFGEFYSCLEDSVNQNMPTRFGTAPMLVTIENGGPVGDALRKTVMFSIIHYSLHIFTIKVFLRFHLAFSLFCSFLLGGLLLQITIKLRTEACI